LIFEYSIFVILLIAAICDVGLPILIGRRYPGYNHLVDTISTLGTQNSPVKKLEQLNLMVIGLLFVIFSILQHFLFTDKTTLVNLYSIGIGLFGAGSVLAGIFPEDEKNTQETASGKIHGIASGIGFMFLGLNPLWAVWIKEFKTLSLVNLLLFIVATTAFILFMISEKKEKGLLKYTGLFQRINLVALYGSLIMNFDHAFIR